VSLYKILPSTIVYVHERVEHRRLGAGCRFGGRLMPTAGCSALTRLCYTHAAELELLGESPSARRDANLSQAARGVSDPRVPHVARTRVARAFTPQSVRRSLAVDVELEVVAVWLEVAVHRLRELVAVARNERRQLHLG
jgi:hypothetical protein